MISAKAKLTPGLSVMSALIVTQPPSVARLRGVTAAFETIGASSNCGAPSTSVSPANASA
jgi:hypothetical protein